MWRAGLAMLSGGIGKLKELTDWKQYGGAPLLGFDRLLMLATSAPTIDSVLWTPLS